jgi:hypothetical protein
MAANFAPFVPARTGAQSAPASAAKPFNPITAQSLAVQPAGTPAGAGVSSVHACGSASANAAVPAVTLQRDGDRITHIRVQCGCGQVIELECSY